ncbi:VOC family protein [Solibacillus sp. FSL R5-0449]|uniref:VOC family protein n=1 Tax=Solibacillus sp. FSL R5-0449 TaxID=2921639 RepID=UPI0030CBABF0
MNIEHITMYASNFEATKQFYIAKLEFPLHSEESDRFTILVGGTAVTFTKAPLNENPFYHFAFDIPSNQFEEAKAWTKGKVTLSKEQGKDEVYFEGIDAKSIYFEDPAGNIVEFICRFSDAKQNTTPFNASSLQKVSEMSIVVKDKLKSASAFHEVSIFERDHKEISAEGLTFMGAREDASYLLFVNEGRTWFFSNKKAEVFPLEVLLTDGVLLKIDGKLELVSSNRD